jgi:hypothetical protein
MPLRLAITALALWLGYRLGRADTWERELSECRADRAEAIGILARAAKELRMCDGTAKIWLDTADYYQWAYLRCARR